MAYKILNPTKSTFQQNKKVVGLKLPLTTKFYVTYSYEDQLVHNLRNLILTRRGERVLQPLFGTRIHEFLFEGIDDMSISKIRNDISQSIDFWMPQVEVYEIKITPIYEMLEIMLRVGFNGKEISEPLTFKFTTE